MTKRVLILALTAAVAAFTSAAPNLAHADPLGEFCLFTTEGPPGGANDTCKCSSTKPATMHVTLTNLDPDQTQVNMVFADGDLVQVRVPTNGTISFTQVIGTNPGKDDAITIDPLDNDGDVNPVVGWASIAGGVTGSGGRPDCVNIPNP